MSLPADDDGVAVVGRLQGAFGVKGWVRVQSFTDPPDNLLGYEPWLLAGDDGWRPVTRRAARPHGDGFVAELEGVRDRDAAQALKGTLIGIAAASLPKPDEDEYYWRDLIGLEVRGGNGELLGRVAEMMATGANDVLVVALETGAEELIPFDRRYVVEVNLAAGRLTVDWELDADH